MWPPAGLSITNKQDNTLANTRYSFRLDGQIKLEKYPDQARRRLKIHAFNTLGLMVGACETNPDGLFSMALTLHYPTDIHLTIKPAEKIFQGGSENAHRHQLVTRDWTSTSQHAFALWTQIEVPKSLWQGWWPQQISVIGCIHDNENERPAEPYHLTLYEVDRNDCWWTCIQHYWDALLDQHCIYGPQPIETDHQPIPLHNQPKHKDSPPPHHRDEFEPSSYSSLTPHVIEQRLQQLTISSDIAPWILHPGRFFRTTQIAETVTDHHGNFRYQFDWRNMHGRQGRRSSQFLPDLIIKARYRADGRLADVYLDPYSSIQWDEKHNRATLNLNLSGENSLWVPHSAQSQPHGTRVYISRIGDDPIQAINQTTGLYSKGELNNIAYGGNLRIHAKFGRHLTTRTPARYYRLSYAKRGSNNFSFLTQPLSDIRVRNDNPRAEQHVLGPHTVVNAKYLYEIRNHNDYRWLTPDLVGVWRTWMSNEGNGVYVLRLEVFDENGDLLNVGNNVHYHGNAARQHSDLSQKECHEIIVTIDNRAPQQLHIDAPHFSRQTETEITVEIQANHPNKRLHYWELTSVIDGSRKRLASSTKLGEQVYSVFEHIPLNPNQLVKPNNAANYAIKPLALEVGAAIRNGYRMIYKRKVQKTIVIDVSAISLELDKTNNKRGAI